MLYNAEYWIQCMFKYSKTGCSGWIREQENGSGTKEAMESMWCFGGWWATLFIEGGQIVHVVHLLMLEKYACLK